MPPKRARQVRDVGLRQDREMVTGDVADIELTSDERPPPRGACGARGVDLVPRKEQDHSRSSVRAGAVAGHGTRARGELAHLTREHLGFTVGGTRAPRQLPEPW